MKRYRVTPLHQTCIRPYFYRISVGGCLIRICIKSNPNLANLNAWATIEFPDQQSKGYVGSIGASKGHLYYFNQNALTSFFGR